MARTSAQLDTGNRVQIEGKVFDYHVSRLAELNVVEI